MVFIRKALLDSEVEKELKIEFSELWLSKDPKRSGTEIAEKLQFGVEGTKYEKLKTNYSYFIRQKFNLPLRKKPSFGKTPEAKKYGLRKSRYKTKPDDVKFISTKDFIEMLNENLPKINSFYYKRSRSFLITIFWTPLRSSEIYERVISDFEITDTKLIVHLLRKKKGHEVGDDDEPIEILRVFPLVEELVSYLQSEIWKIEIKDKYGKIVKDKNGEPKLNQRPWNISHDTALNYTKELSKELCCHYFRFRFLTDGASNPKISIAELKAKSRLTLPALEHYLMATKALDQSYNRKIMDQLRKEGLVQEEKI